MASTIWDLSQRASSALTGNERVPLAVGSAAGQNAYMEVRQLLGTPYSARVAPGGFWNPRYNSGPDNGSTQWNLVASTVAETLSTTFDTAGLWDAANNRFVIPVTGLYNINIEVEIDPPAVSDFDAMLCLGQNNPNGGTSTFPPGGNTCYGHAQQFFNNNSQKICMQVNIADILPFNANDSVYLFSRGLSNSTTDTYGLFALKYSISLLHVT